jgi:hypothetical protein
LGAQTIVAYQRPAVSGGLTLAYGAAGTYAGWDRFGRIVDQKWTNASGNTASERARCISGPQMPSALFIQR